MSPPQGIQPNPARMMKCQFHMFNQQFRFVKSFKSLIAWILFIFVLESTETIPEGKAGSFWINHEHFQTAASSAADVKPHSISHSNVLSLLASQNETTSGESITSHQSIAQWAISAEENSFFLDSSIDASRAPDDLRTCIAEIRWMAGRAYHARWTRRNYFDSFYNFCFYSTRGALSRDVSSIQNIKGSSDHSPIHQSQIRSLICANIDSS